MKDFHKSEFDDATKIKLCIFQGYIREWLSVFMTRPSYSNSPKTIRIFDFFSGPGYDSKNNPGSPIIIVDEIIKYCQLREDYKATVHVELFFNDVNANHINQLQQNLNAIACDKPCCKYHFSAIPFRDIFMQSLPMLKDENSAKLLIIDQFGVTEVTSEILRFLSVCKRIDVLFFIASSFVYRFAATPEIGSKLKINVNQIKNSDYNEIHKNMCDHFQRELNSENYYLAPFSIKKGANIYGLIFGSSNLYGLEKFLSVCWKIDNLTGEANYSIEGEDYWNGKLSLFSEENSFRKIDRFKHELIEFFASPKTNKETYRFALLKGFPPHKTNEILKELQNENKIETISATGDKRIRKGSFYLGYTQYNETPKINIRVIK